MHVLCLVSLSTFFITVHNGESSVIPAYLEECYSQPTPRSLPLTVCTLIELIRKASFNPFTPVSLAQQAADVLNWFAVDGLERDPWAVSKKPGVFPYHRSGLQALKQDLIFDKLIQFVRKLFQGAPLSMTLLEKCSLHFMLSAAVDPWQRGDESETCPISYQQFSESSVGLSACPLEAGVFRTPWGTVGGGQVLGGLLAALAPQSVSVAQILSQTAASEASVDNVWAATLAGDLAEVAVLQSPQYTMDVDIGIKGEWNDSYIPTKFYFQDVLQNVIERQNWQMTDAEILGGIDGLLIGAMAIDLKQTMPDIRLSQLLDMYYSETRVLSRYHACKRKSAFNSFIRDKKNVLITQTQNFAKLLSTKTTTYFTNATILDGRCLKAVEKFLRYYSDLLEIENCPGQMPTSMMMNVNMIIDATWPPYTTLQFLMHFTQDIEIGFYGGRIVTLSEDSMTTLAHSANSPTALYQNINVSQDYRDSISLVYKKAFLALKASIEESNKNDKDLSTARRASQDIVVVIGYSSTISDKDLQQTKDILRVIKMQNPALRMVYWSSHVGAPSFVRLTAVPRSHNDAILTTDGPRLPSLLTKLQDTAQSTARNLKPAYCTNNLRGWSEVYYDEIITPGEIISYWIHPDYLCGSHDIVKITFKNYEYGGLSVCVSRSPVERGECLAADEGREMTHSLVRPCSRSEVPPAAQQWHPDCLPVYFTVAATHSADKCSGYECRYPDQVKFTIIVQDLRCINLKGDVCAGSNELRSYITHTICIIFANILIKLYS